MRLTELTNRQLQQYLLDLIKESQKRYGGREPSIRHCYSRASARIVIAGKTDTQGPELRRIIEVIRSLKPYTDYETDENDRNIFLTDTGLSQGGRNFRLRKPI